MGIRLEWAIILLILITIGLTSTVRLEDTKQNTNRKNKELEFYKTELIEVDTDRMISKSFVYKGVRKGETLYLEQLFYSTDSISSLVSQNANFYKNILTLKDRVTIKTEQGHTYKTLYAEYDQKNKILTVPVPFVSYYEKNIIYGESLVYDAQKKELNATKINAVLYTAKK